MQLSCNSKTKNDDHKEISNKQMRRQCRIKNKQNQLPLYFYEDILLLESRITHSFKMEDFEKLFELYLIGIDYYELGDRTKLSGFQYRLNWILQQPEVTYILKKCNKSIKQDKEAENIDIENQRLKKDIITRVSFKKRLKNNDNEYTLQEEYNLILNQINSSASTINTEIENILNNEYAKQKNSLRQRLRLKKDANITNYFSNNDIILTHQNNEENNTQPSLLCITEINSTSPDASSSRNNQSFDNESIDENNKGDSNIDLIQFPFKEIDSSSNQKKKTNYASSLTLNKTSSTIDKTDLMAISVLGLKQKEMIISIKDKVDDYLQVYNQYVFEEHYKKVVKQIQQLFSKKYHQYVEVSKSYMNQIKETQYKLYNSNTSISDEQKELIISYLEEEKEDELSRIDDKYDTLLKDHLNSFKSLGYMNKQTGFVCLQEQAKLDIYNCMLELM